MVGCVVVVVALVLVVVVSACEVVVRIYLASKFHPGHRNRNLVDRISTAFESEGVETVCVARDFERWGETMYQRDELMRVASGAIDECSAVVVEFSEKGVGLGIEAG